MKLAINGGKPVRNTAFPAWPVWGEPEERRLLEVLRSGSWSALSGGKKTSELERRFAELVGVEYAVSANNGTSTLMMSLKAVGVAPGDEVIVPAYTFLATATAVLFCHAVPVFADIDIDTFCLDVRSVREQITERTKAIIAVHIGGRPADMDALTDLAKSRGLALIEDCAQAHGARWRGRHVGSIGDIGSFSFQASKNVTSGEGGIVTTNDQAIADLAWSYHNCGRTRGGRWYGHSRLGWNLRMTEFEAAILLGQLERFEEQAARRDENGRYLDAQLSQIPGVKVMAADPRVTSNAYHLYIFRIEPEEFDGVTRDRFVAALRAEGIPCSSGYVPLYKEPVFADPQGDTGQFLKAIGRRPDFYADVDLPDTVKACDLGVWIPQAVLLGDRSDMDSIVAAVSKVRENARELVEAKVS